MFSEHLHEALDKKVCLECNRQFTGIVAACPHDGGDLVPMGRDPLVGTCLMGKYDIIDVIGHGGMGVVYKGRQVMMDRTVAIKMLQTQHIADSMSVKRFYQEGKAASKMNHPHVITVYDFGVTANTGQPFIVMDYLQGVALSDLIKDEGQLGVERSIKVLSQATDALDHAHRMGVIHRDLKPSNIMLIDYEDEKDYVKVVDFGVAKLITAGGEQQRLTQMGEVCGSPVYMSPEQCQGLELDNRSDIYSMGIVIYETLTGRLPILGKTMVDTMSKHITDMPPHFNEVRPDLYIPERLEAVVFKALAKDPADRHQSMAELTRDLETAIPRPGKSAVLRSDAPQQGAAVEAKKALPVKVLVIAAVTLLVGGLGLKFVLDASQPKVKPVQAVVPVSPAVAPGAVKPNTAPNGANPNAASPGSTAVVNPGAASSSSSSSSSGSATATSAAPGSHASNASNASNATSANSAASGTGATSAAVVQSQSPKEPVKEVVKLTHEVKEVREKPRVAAQPRVKKVRKVAVKAESADDVVPTGAGSAAAYARRSAAGGDPWKDLKSSRRY